MFAIYSIEGRRFHDTLENLRKVRKAPTTQAMPFRISDPIDETQPIAGNASDRTDEIIVSRNALKAYREIRHLNEREPIYHAYQLMTHPVHTISMDMEILEARRYFQEHSVNQMPVISSQQRIVGMLSIENLLQFIIVDGEQLKYLRGKNVADAMSTEVITTDPVSDIRRVAQVMHEYRLHAVPIVDDREALIGIVSRGDILRAVTNDPPLNMWS